MQIPLLEDKSSFCLIPCKHGKFIFQYVRKRLNNVFVLVLLFFVLPSNAQNIGSLVEKWQNSNILALSEFNIYSEGYSGKKLTYLSQQEVRFGREYIKVKTDTSNFLLRSYRWDLLEYVLEQHKNTNDFFIIEQNTETERIVWIVLKDQKQHYTKAIYRGGEIEIKQTSSSDFHYNDLNLLYTKESFLDFKNVKSFYESIHLAFLFIIKI